MKCTTLLQRFEGVSLRCLAIGCALLLCVIQFFYLSEHLNKCTQKSVTSGSHFPSLAGDRGRSRTSESSAIAGNLKGQWHVQDLWEVSRIPFLLLFEKCGNSFLNGRGFLPLNISLKNTNPPESQNPLIPEELRLSEDPLRFWRPPHPSSLRLGVPSCRLLRSYGILYRKRGYAQRSPC